MDPDPYSTAMATIGRALKRGLDEGDSMSDTEYETLQRLALVIADRDPLSAKEFLS